MSFIKIKKPNLTLKIALRRGNPLIDQVLEVHLDLTFLGIFQKLSSTEVRVPNRLHPKFYQNLKLTQLAQEPKILSAKVKHDFQTALLHHQLALI